MITERFSLTGSPEFGTIYAASYGQGIFIDTTYYLPWVLNLLVRDKQQFNPDFPNPVKITLRFHLHYLQGVM